MTTATYGAADMKADWCRQGDEVCDVATACTECDQVICPDHSDEFVQCANNPDVLHHDECRSSCVDCVGAGAEDHAAGA